MIGPPRIGRSLNTNEGPAAQGHAAVLDTPGVDTVSTSRMLLQERTLKQDRAVSNGQRDVVILPKDAESRRRTAGRITPVILRAQSSQGQ
jgi:hypothetical protein